MIQVPVTPTSQVSIRWCGLQLRLFAAYYSSNSRILRQERASQPCRFTFTSEKLSSRGLQVRFPTTDSVHPSLSEKSLQHFPSIQLATDNSGKGEKQTRPRRISHDPFVLAANCPLGSLEGAGECFLLRQCTHRSLSISTSIRSQIFLRHNPRTFPP